MREFLDSGSVHGTIDRGRVDSSGGRTFLLSSLKQKLPKSCIVYDENSASLRMGTRMKEMHLGKKATKVEQ